MKKYLFIIAIIVGTGFAPALAQKNSQWRGENRDGVYNETGLLKEWPADGPELLWSFDGLGDGYTSVSIANEKIYITGLEEDSLVLFVFDLKGKLLNRKIVGKEWTKNYNGPRCSVLVHEGKLYIGNSLGQLFCLDETTLSEIWKKDGLNDFDGRNIMFGVTENPLIVGDKIFMTPGGVVNNVVALNKNTGELIWSSTGTGTVSTYASPLFIGDQSVPMVITYLATSQQGLGRGVPRDNKIVALNANTGEVIWTHPQPSGNTINPNTPIYKDGYIFSSTGYAGGSLLLRLKDGGKAVEQVWFNNADNQHHGPLKIGDYIYTTAHNNRGFHCIDWKTGETKYREDSQSQSSMVYADGLIYAYDDRGNMNLIRPNPDRFELVSKFKITLGTNEHWAHPVIHNGILYIRHGDALMAYKIKN